LRVRQGVAGKKNVPLIEKTWKSQKFASNHVESNKKKARGEDEARGKPATLWIDSESEKKT